MNQLIRTEWLKIKYYRAFWWIITLTALTYPGINYISYNIYLNIIERKDMASKLAKMIMGTPFSFPEVWHTTAYFSSFFVFIPSIVVIMFITNEYTFKTHRQNIIDGWSRNQFMTSKLIDVAMTTLMITALYTIVCLIIGFININDKMGSIWQQSYFIGLFALQTFAQLSLAFLIGILVRKAFIALGIFLFYYLILENTMVLYAKFKLNDIGRFLPFEVSDRLIPYPAFFNKVSPDSYQAALDAIPYHVIYSIILTAIVWFISFRVYNRRDL
ncbi:MAG TPA: ABC transporter permease [Flavisolibacter sp.]|nr:ABC transporter permease [Flavisolibacter sp.]